eukprot:12410666-Karenia_brevis.AAC.1
MRCEAQKIRGIDERLAEQLEEQVRANEVGAFAALAAIHTESIRGPGAIVGGKPPGVDDDV